MERKMPQSAADLFGLRLLAKENREIVRELLIRYF